MAVIVENDTGTFVWTAQFEEPVYPETEYNVNWFYLTFVDALEDGDTYSCFYNLYSEKSLVWGGSGRATQFGFAVPIIFGFFLIVVVGVCIVMEIMMRCPRVTVPLCNVEYVYR